jgi:hypothetical protein
MADRPYFDANGLPASAAPPAAARAQDREEIERLVDALVMYAREDARRAARGMPSDGGQGRARTILLSAFDRARAEGLEEAAREYDEAEKNGAAPIRPRHVAAHLRRRSLACPASTTGNPIDCGGCPEHAAPSPASLPTTTKET